MPGPRPPEAPPGHYGHTGQLLDVHPDWLRRRPPPARVPHRLEAPADPQADSVEAVDRDLDLYWRTLAAERRRLISTPEDAS